MGGGAMTTSGLGHADGPLLDSSYWDSVADQYQESLHAPDGRAYRAALETFLRNRGALRLGDACLDIGSGAGKYALIFGLHGCSVTMLDVSSAMLAHARANMAKAGLPATSVLEDWGRVDLGAHGFEGAFDLVFSSKCPAVMDGPSLRKVSRASRRHCFVSVFSAVENRLFNQYCAALGLDVGARGSFEDRSERLAREIRALGYAPVVAQRDESWENRLVPKEAARRFLFEYGRTHPVSPELALRVHALSEELADEQGVVHEVVPATAAWLYWTVG